jgi:hypothetical protein
MNAPSKRSERLMSPEFREQAQSTRVEDHTTSMLPKSAKMKIPEAYEGKRGPEFNTFLMKMELYFEHHEGLFDDRKKIISTLTNVGEGEGARWAQPYLKKMLRKEEHPHLRSWGAFINAFHLQFGDSMRKERAACEITKLTQTRSAQCYITQFWTLAEELDWDKAALLNRFCSGLKTDIRQELLKLSIGMSEEEIEEMRMERWMDCTVRVDDVLFTAWGMDKQASGSGNKGSTYRNND